MDTTETQDQAKRAARWEDRKAYANGLVALADAILRVPGLPIPEAGQDADPIRILQFNGQAEAIAAFLHVAEGVTREDREDASESGHRYVTLRGTVGGLRVDYVAHTYWPGVELLDGVPEAQG